MNHDNKNSQGHYDQGWQGQVEDALPRCEPRDPIQEIHKATCDQENQMSQADDYARAIDTALHEVTEKYDTPALNALLGALATRAGMGLAMIEDQKMKKLMFEQVCTEIKRAMNVPSKTTAILVPIFPQKEDIKH